MLKTTIAQVIARMLEQQLIRPDDRLTTEMLDECDAPLPEKLSMANVATLLTAQHATPSTLFLKRFRDTAIDLALAEDIANSATIVSGCECPAWESKRR